MEHVGVICEYNPFHAGHAYLLREAKTAGGVVCLMSGNFTQRGEAALLPPAVRAEMALAAGADLVLELPFPFSASSAEHFARCGVRALTALGVRTLMFGSECGDTGKLTQAARRLCAPDVPRLLAEEGKRRGAVRVLFEYLGEAFSSNDLLAIHYIKATMEMALPLTPVAIKRIGGDFRSTDAEISYPSATALREKLNTSGDISAFLPPETRGIWQAGVRRYGIADTRRLGTAILALLRGNGADKTHFPEIAECDAGLLARLAGAAFRADSYEELCAIAANKSYTDGRIRRALLMLLAGVTQQDIAAARPAYLKLLACDRTGREMLSATRKTRTVPVVTKHSGVERFGESARRQRELARVSDGLYALCFPEPLPPALLQTMPPVLYDRGSDVPTRMEQK